VSAVRAFGPGRVNLIGEHTDYNDGLCLPFAIAAGVTVEASDGPVDAIDAHALDLGETDTFALGDPEPADGWRAFVRGTAAELGRAGHALRGATLRIHGDVPRGSGLSSSAALEVALALALVAHNGQPEPDRRDLAKLCSRVENDWVGAETGLLDQLASLCAREGHALRIDFRTLALEAVPLDLGGCLRPATTGSSSGWTLATLDSGASHEHASGGYNERRAECRAACEQLGIGSLREAPAAQIETLPDPLDRRARHVFEENARVDEMIAALGAGDLIEVGRLLDASHASLRDLYDASVPEVERTVAQLKIAGATGARMVGGGFGGAVLALLAPGLVAPAAALTVTPGPPAALV
jgi:galactokinase